MWKAAIVIDEAATTIVVAASVARTIAKEARASRDGTETGGVLLGTTSNDTLVIRHAGEPGPNATRQATFFRRDLQHAQALADWAYEHDRSVWIGEWHTHIQGPAVPSSRDLATYRMFLDDPELALAYFVAIILADPTNEWTQPRTATWIITPTRACVATDVSLTRHLAVVQTTDGDSDST